MSRIVMDSLLAYLGGNLRDLASNVPSRTLPLCLVLWSAGGPPRVLAADEAVIDSLSRANASALLLQARIPTNSYAIVEQASDAAAPFSPVSIVVPTTPGAVRAGLPVATAARAALFRVRAVPLAFPLDTDGDGMDDVYEARRGPFLNPLDPADGQRDADGDGESNLTEYLDRTEAAPPLSDAPVVYASLADLRRVAPLPLPALVHLGGYDRDGDGWGGWFAWREDDARTADDALVVSLGTNGPGRLERVVEAGDSVQTAWWRPPSNTLADAGPALQKALDYLATRTVRRLVINPGRYRVTAQIAYETPSACPLSVVGLDDFEIEGAGATIWTTSDGEMLMFKDCHRVAVRNLALEGAGSDRSLPDGNYGMISLVGQQTDFEFSNCRLSGFMHGISHVHGEKTTTRVQIRGCQFVDGGDLGHGTLLMDGAAISGIGSDWTIADNFFHECARGVEIENSAKVLPIQRVVVTGNRITNLRNIGIMAFLGGDAASATQQTDNVIRDNIIVGRRPRMIDPRGNVVPIMHIALNGGSRWSIQGNLCDDADYAGISLYANQAPVEDSVISGNVVTRIGGRGIQVYNIASLYLRGVVVSNNRIRECYDSGLLIVGNHVLAEGNLLENVLTGIEVGDTVAPEILATDVIVRGNTLRDIPAPFPAVLVAPSAVNAIISGNAIRGANVGVRNLSSTTTLSGNEFLEVPTEVETANP